MNTARSVLEAVHRELLPLDWTRRRLKDYRWCGAVLGPVQTAFTLTYDLPTAVRHADLHRQPDSSVAEEVWAELEECVRRLIRRKIVTADVPITAIDEILTSKAARNGVRFSTIDHASSYFAPHYERMSTADLLAGALKRDNRNFTYATWHRRLRWNNADGSHRMAAAITQNRPEPPVYTTDARVAIEQLDLAAIARLGELVAIFLLPPGGQQRRHYRRGPGRNLTELLPRDIPWRSAEIRHYERQRDIVMLPLGNPRARALAAALKAGLPAERFEVVEAFRRLAATQAVPAWLCR